MQLIDINKTRYRRHLNIVIALCAGGLAIGSLGISQTLIALFPDESGSHFHWNLLGVVIASVAMAWLLIPNLGNLLLPVIAYLITITAMGLLAVQSSFPVRWVLLGAMLFIISDSFIAINKFIHPFPFESYWIMGTYYAAQFMLVMGFLKSVRQNKKTNY